MISKTLRYIDEKSDKFWRVETLDAAMVTNWGKAGVNGKYALKEFDSEEECRKEAEKLIPPKRKRATESGSSSIPCATTTSTTRSLATIP